jgi:hypothetical protein
VSRPDDDRADGLADALLSATFEGGDVDAALADIHAEDAHAVLGLVVRRLAAIAAAQQLRGLGQDGDVDPEPKTVDVGAAAVADGDLPPDPWSSTGNATSDALEEGRTVYEALVTLEVEQVLRAIKALDPEELAVVVLERVLVAMAERRRAPGAG